VSSERFDVVIVGAGTAGAAAARQFARRGARVALVDGRRLDEAGARWVNGVPPWMFDEAGVDRPETPELRGAGGPFTLLGTGGTRALSITPAPVWGVDMRLLVQRLQSDARGAGAMLIDQARVGRLHLASGRPIELEVTPGAGPRRTLRADLFVDASGMGGVLRRQVPVLARDCRAPGRVHICSAAQAVCGIRDVRASDAFLERHQAKPGEILCRPGVSGGYSIGNVCVDVHPDGSRSVDLLTGAIATEAYRSGPAILADLRARHAWIGEKRFGGAGAIPLRRPYDRLAAPGIALLGNAACQVFSAHGSGIGIGMVAARMLANAATLYPDPGGPRAMWSYQAGFHRRWGGLLGAYDLFRRFTQSLEGEAVGALLAAGLVTEAGYRAGLDQRLPPLNPAELAATLRGVATAPRLASRVLPTLTRMAPAVALYGRYPERPSERALGVWSRAAARLFGDPVDVRP
jgi:flavin-dependent dehydrogenase